MQDFVRRLALKQIEELTLKLDNLAEDLEAVSGAFQIVTADYRAEELKAAAALKRYPLSIYEQPRCLLCARWRKPEETFCMKHKAILEAKA